MALAFIPSLGAAISAAPAEETGTASGLVNTSYQIGSALGLAVLTAAGAAVTAGRTSAEAIDAGYSTAFLGAAAIALLGAPIVGATLSRAGRKDTAASPEGERVSA